MCRGPAQAKHSDFLIPKSTDGDRLIVLCMLSRSMLLLILLLSLALPLLLKPLPLLPPPLPPLQKVLLETEGVEPETESCRLPAAATAAVREGAYSEAARTPALRQNH